MATPSFSRSTSFLIVIAAYILCLGAGYGALMIGQHYLSPVWNMLVADIAATLMIWCFSIIVSNASMYDAYWSVIPIAVVYYWIKMYAPDGWSCKNILLMTAVSYWGIRLTYNWARGWSGLSHQDWRYKMLEDKNPSMYWVTNLMGIHLFPTIIVFLCLMPTYYLITIPADSSLILVGFIISILGTSIELVADEQMRRFRKTAQKSDYIDWGFWHYSRHPNYFGEITFWAGLFVMSVGAAGLGYIWLGIGVVCLIAMFVFASIPMMDEKTLKSRPHYAEQIKRVSALVPWFRKG